MSKTVTSEESLSARLDRVRERIANAARKSGRARQDIALIGISKTHPIDLLRAAMDAGISDLGENRVQEAEPKIQELGREAARWHLVGHLQPNKARKAIRLFDVIHSLDSISLATRLDRICSEENRKELPVLLQVDLGGEETKSGVSERELLPLADTVRNCARLNLLGLMTLPPFFDDPERARPFFSRLRELRDDLKVKGFFAAHGELSMGMTNDFEVAIEEGATMLRIGTAIFGERGARQSV